MVMSPLASRSPALQASIPALPSAMFTRERISSTVTSPSPPQSPGQAIDVVGDGVAVALADAVSRAVALGVLVAVADGLGVVVTVKLALG